MKIIDIHAAVTSSQLANKISEKLNPMFEKQRQIVMPFKIEDKGGFVEISQPENYEGFLFRIEIVGTHLHITRSEHYVDDVNSLTVESILSDIYDDLSGDKQTAMVVEG